jgi:type IV pilus assembly protein PilV
MKSRTRGFSLIEVLVALLVISIGLLGIAKMQALALSNTNGGRLRALAAIEAASLASAMEAERNYWGNLTVTENVTVSSAAGSATVTSPQDTTLAGTVTCPASASAAATTMTSCTGTVTCISTATPCNAQKMAAYDLQQWAGRLQEIMGTSASASVICTATTPPVSCQITVNWAEQTVNSNTSEAGGTMGIPSYTLFVNP